MKVEKQNDGTFLCLLCFDFFDDLSDVHKHVPFCGKPKTAKEALKLEKLETFTCSACDLSFDSRRKIDKHYRDPKCLKVQQLIVDQAAKLKGNQSLNSILLSYSLVTTWLYEFPIPNSGFHEFFNQLK